jgi:ribonuclease Z
MDPFGTVPFSGYFVQAVPGYHGTPSLGYVLAEYPRPGRFDREKAITLGLSPGPLFGRLQAGEAVQVTRNGKTFTVYPGDVMGPSRPGRKIVYSGDTRPAYREWEGIACDADLLIHDATFEDEEAERARDVYHSTAGEAGEAARFLRASALALIHISSRYTGASNHLRDAKKYFSGSITAPGDLTVLNIPFRE